MYWDIGKPTVRVKNNRLGNNALEKLANDLKNDYPEMKGILCQELPVHDTVL